MITSKTNIEVFEANKRMGEGMGTGKICEPVSGVRCIEVCVYTGKGHLPM